MPAQTVREDLRGSLNIIPLHYAGHAPIALVAYMKQGVTSDLMRPLYIIYLSRKLFKNLRRDEVSRRNAHITQELE